MKRKPCMFLGVFFLLLNFSVEAMPQEEKVEFRAYMASKRVSENKPALLWRCWSLIGDLNDWLRPTIWPYGLKSSPLTAALKMENAHLEFWSKDTEQTARGLIDALGHQPVGFVGTTRPEYSWSASEEARNAFLNILDLMDAPVLYMEPSTTKEQLLHIPDKAQKIWEQFDAFATKFPKERRLVGYARLYSVVLRTAINGDYSSTLSLVEKLALDYEDVHPIAIMALWYKGLLQAWFQKPEAKATFLQLFEQYKEKGWWVVSAAKVMASRPIPNFHTDKESLKEPDMSCKPLDIKRVHHNISLFFERRREIVKALKD